MIRTDIASTVASSTNCATKSLQVMAGVANHHLVCESCNTSLPSIGQLLTHQLACPGELSVNRKNITNAATGSKGIQSLVQPAPKDKNSVQALLQGKLLECPLCKRKFARPSACKRHLGTHTNIKPYQCGTCRKCFRLSGYLTRHLRTHTGEKPFACQHCTLRFSRQDKFRQHQQEHIAGNLLRCQECDIDFKCARSLQSHLKWHNTKRLFQCTLCLKSFSATSNLKVHMRIHTGEKPFFCQYCNKPFRQLGHLKAHLSAKHLEDKTYLCRHCDTGFTSTVLLIDHLLTHMKETPSYPYRIEAIKSSLREEEEEEKKRPPVLVDQLNLATCLLGIVPSGQDSSESFGLSGSFPSELSERL